MKNLLRYIIVIILAAAAGGIIWWQFNKKGVIRNQIEKAVARGTDSTYYIHYDSSRIDEIAGNAVFYNIVLQSDSLQQQLYTDDTAGMARTIFNVRIEKLSITGANIPSFLSKNTLEAQTIEIVRPVITLINTGKEEPVQFTAADTLALYEKLTGKFKRIQAGEIKIIDGTIAFARGKKSPHTGLQGVYVDLKNLKIDSTRNYDNIISYLVKDVRATVKTANVKNEKAGRLLTFEGIEYNAPGRFLEVNKFLQKDLRTEKVIISLANSRVTGLSTNAFIINRVLKADSLSTDGGILGFYRGKKAGASNETLEIDNNFFDEAIVKNIRLGNTTLSLYNRANVNEAPMVLKNLKFNASGIDSIYTGTDMLKLIGNSNWDLSAGGFSFLTKDKIYKVDIGPVLLDKFNNAVSVQYAALTPVISEAAFVRSLKFQKDLFNLRFNNIRLTGADVQKIITDREIIADELSFQPLLNIFNDRTVTPDTASKMGKYPHQMLKLMKPYMYFKTVKINNGNVVYKERGALSKKTGDVSFHKVNAVISNMTNIDRYVKKNSDMIMKVNCKFLNMANISSVWTLPLNSPNGAFEIRGNVGPFDGTKLNPVIEPLGMGSVNSGNIKSYVFAMQGENLKADGEALLLYDHLKLKLLKNTGDSNKLETKGVTSFVANILIKDKNPSGGYTRKADLGFKRVMTKSFFNLVWKSIFAGAKTSIK
ncbi:MAG: hypothetical protein WKF88_03070 [Ferruginibacter sp.]